MHHPPNPISLLKAIYKGGNTLRKPVFALSVLLVGASLSGCGGDISHSASSPSITSFTPASSSIVYGKTTTLTSVFKNGTGVIMPGSLAVATGDTVTINPLTTTTYTLTVTGTTTTTSVTSSATITVQPVTAPAPPTNLTGTAGDKVVYLSWTASPSADIYLVYRKLPTDSLYQYVGETFSTVYEDAPVTNGKSYTYMVHSRITSGLQVIEGTDSNTVTLTPKAASTGISEDSEPVSAIVGDEAVSE